MTDERIIIRTAAIKTYGLPINLQDMSEENVAFLTEIVRLARQQPKRRRSYSWVPMVGALLVVAIFFVIGWADWIDSL